MLASILSLGILALSPLAAAQLFHGCVSSSFNSGTAQAAGTGSVAACNSACGTKYFYYRAAATSPCQCSDTDPYRFTPAQTTLVSSIDSAGTCPTTAFSVSLLLDPHGDKLKQIGLDAPNDISIRRMLRYLCTQRRRAHHFESWVISDYRGLLQRGAHRRLQPGS